MLKRACSAQGQIAGTNECGNRPSGSMRGGLAGLEEMSCTKFGTSKNRAQPEEEEKGRRSRRMKKCRRQCGTLYLLRKSRRFNSSKWS